MTPKSSIWLYQFEKKIKKMAPALITQEGATHDYSPYLRIQNYFSILTIRFVTTFAPSLKRTK